jgi:hypothetical protein
MADHEHLPSGNAGAARQREISSGSEDAGQRFVRDLGQVLGQLGELKRELQRKAEEIRGLHGIANRERRFFNLTTSIKTEC